MKRLVFLSLSLIYSCSAMQVTRRPSITLINDTQDEDTYVVQDDECVFSLPEGTECEVDPDEHDYTLVYCKNCWHKIIYCKAEHPDHVRLSVFLDDEDEDLKV